MPINVTMPALSPTMEEGNLAKWHVKEGDSVSSGDVIAEIETDKATMEVEAVDEGTIAKILVAEGTEAVKVNAVIAVLAEDGEDVAEAAKGAGSDDAPAPAAEEQKADVAPEKAPEEKADAKADAPAPKAAPAPANNTGKVFSSPLARRIAEQNGIDLAAVSGSGPNGRIIKRDIEAAIESGTGKAPAKTPDKTDGAPVSEAAPAPKTMSDQQVLQLYAEGSYETLPHDTMRKTIAARLTESAQTIPSYFLTVECRLDKLLKLRAEINSAAPANEDGKPTYKVSVNDFIVKAMALALKDVPMANASWTSSARILHKHADVGVAVAIPDGLITPVVRQAETKALSVISNEIKDMAGRAKDRKLKPEEYQGGSTAVSNLGMFGVSDFTSIINPPHASIVSIGAGEQRAVVENGALAAATVMNATFAFDHRVIDGALGAILAGAFKNYLEKPMSMLV